MLIILISGKQGSGKTTLATKLENHFYLDNFVKLRFAQPLYEMHDKIREVLKDYNFEDYDYTKKDGPLLQMLGTEWGRKNINDQIWVKLLLNKLKSLPDYSIVSVEDCRFENEFDAFNDVKNVLKIRLDCDKEIRKQRCSMWRENDSHASETGLDEYAKNSKFDLTLDSGQLNETEIFILVLEKLNEILTKER